MNNINTESVNRLTFLLTDDLNVRADVSISADKIYYRFATPDTVEDGELPGEKDNFSTLIEQLLESVNSGCQSADISPVRFKLYINNQAYEPKSLTLKTLSAFIDILAAKHAEFIFLSNLI